jgi:hypothetical protein
MYQFAGIFTLRQLPDNHLKFHILSFNKSLYVSTVNYYYLIFLVQCIETGDQIMTFIRGNIQQYKYICSDIRNADCWRLAAFIFWKGYGTFNGQSGSIYL